jgi:hypothetical protein
MEKKWDTVIPADMKRLCETYMYVPLVTKGLTTICVVSSCSVNSKLEQLLHSIIDGIISKEVLKLNI